MFKKQEYVFKGMSLKEWFEINWLIPVPGVEKYRLLQKLTINEATHIMHLMAESTQVDLSSPEDRQEPWLNGYPYRDFLSGYMCILLAPGINTDVNKWRNMLWKVLPDVHKSNMRKYAREVWQMEIMWLHGICENCSIGLTYRL